MTTVVSLDFELGGVLKLRDVGADVWTKDPATMPIMAGFAIDHDEPGCIVFDFLRSPLGVTVTVEHQLALERRLLVAIDTGAEIHAWNAPFEWAVWNNICVPRFGWPALPIDRFYCTMAAAACAGLPMALGDAAKAVGSPYQKDAAGHRAMLRMSRPRGVDPDGAVHWWHRTDPIKLKALIDYNLDDVRAEREVHLRIPRMTKRERRIWLVDQAMNQRGLPVDRDLLAALSVLTLQELLRINRDVAKLTKGEIASVSQVGALLQWLQTKGYPHNTLERETIDAFIQSPEFWFMEPFAQSVLALRAEAAKTSTAKLNSISNYAMADGVVRNLVQYGGAVRTLRWAGRGPQIQNFPRPVIKHVDDAIREIKLGMDANSLRWLYGKPLDVVSSCLRGVFAAPRGFSFVVADYHAIEAVVLAWLADFDDMLNVFRRGEDIYMFTANGVGSTNRTLGKVLRLACGYGMGAGKFQETAASYGLVLTHDEAAAAVHDFRRANAPIVALWHSYEATAKRAIMEPGNRFACHGAAFRMADPKGRLAGSLLMELPSGRNLVYRNVRIDSLRIVFWGVNQYTRRWCEQDTYGGKLVENATQAVARDLLADAIVDLEDHFPGTLLATIHDEIVAMTSTEAAPYLLSGMKTLMSLPPAWAKGMPLSCAGAVVKRYGKI
jgi:DNA polymerase bacteriophage-type